MRICLIPPQEILALLLGKHPDHKNIQKDNSGNDYCRVWDNRSGPQGIDVHHQGKHSHLIGQPHSEIKQNDTKDILRGYNKAVWR